MAPINASGNDTEAVVGMSAPAAARTPALAGDSPAPAADTTPSKTSNSETGSRPITIVIDALGGDNAPAVVCDGVRAYLQSESDVNIILTGSAQAIEPLVQEFPGRVEAVVTTQAIGMDEHPAAAIKHKKDSSIVVACQLVKEGRADAFFSAGSTGASMAAATLIIGRIKGVARPAILTVIPAPACPVVLIDIGANADIKPANLLQFAFMGRAYAKAILGVASPRIGLLNIGSEEKKGSALTQEVYALLAEQLEGFAGNAEGNDFFSGAFDCIVTDGFTGNVVLKTLEGTSAVLFKEIKKALMSSFTAKLGAALVKGRLAGLKETFSADKVGGAPLLGLRNVVIIGHGSSNAKAIVNGIHAAAFAVRAQLPQLIEKEISAEKDTRPEGALSTEKDTRPEGTTSPEETTSAEKDTRPEGALSAEKDASQ